MLSGTVANVGRCEMLKHGKDDERDDAMSSRAAAGFWAVATVYAAIGVIGVFLLATQPNIARSADGYGAFRLAAQK